MWFAAGCVPISSYFRMFSSCDAAARHHRPQRLDLVAPDVEEARPDRGVQPLVQRRAVVVDVEIVAREGEVREGVRAIHEDLDPLLPRHLHDLPHRENLPGEVGDVRDFDDAGARRDRRAELLDDVVVRRRRHLERDLLEDDPVAPYPLLPCSDHPTVVLVRDDHLVAALEVEPENHGLVGLRRVAHDRHLLGIAAEHARQVAPRRFDLRLEHRPHVVDRDLVRELEVPDHHVENMRRRWTHAAVVQVHQRPVVVKRHLDLRPVRLVIGCLERRLAAHHILGTKERRKCRALEDGERNTCAHHR